MSLNIEGEKCALCKSYLFKEDDIVYCPECGAPHHRECYNSIGKCAFSENHGTEFEYKKPKSEESESAAEAEREGSVKCGMCGEAYPLEEDYCPNCHTVNALKIGASMPFDLLGGVPKDMDLGAGVKAQEAKRFVFSNTHRYIPKFAAMTMGKRASWNWFAFLIPCGWFLSRKMYGLGALIGALTVAFSMLLFPFNNALNQLDTASLNPYELMPFITENMELIGKTAFIVAIVGSVLSFALRIFSGLFGDCFYRRHTIETVSRLKRESDDLETDMRKKGGVSIIWMLIGFFAVQYLPALIAMLTGI